MKGSYILIFIIFLALYILWYPYSVSANVIFSEFFPNTGPTNTWSPLPAPYNDTVAIVHYPGSPGKGGDGYVGSLADVDLNFYGIAAIWSGDSTLSDYIIEAWLFCPITLWGGVVQQPWIMGRVNPYSNAMYSRFIINLTTPNVRFQSYDGSWETTPLYMPTGYNWPTEDGWHKVKFKIVGDTIWCWFDDILLATVADATVGNSFTQTKPASTLLQGAWGFGMLNYQPTGVISGATTYIDDFVVRSDETIDINPPAAILTIGETIYFSGVGGIEPYTYVSSDTSVGTIDSTSGLFTAVGLGTCNVTATDYYGYSGTAIVNVVATEAPLATEEKKIIIQRWQFLEELFE